MKIQVLFGSANDERVYGPLCRSLELCGDVKMDVASAHRDPDKVQSIVKTCNADVFVAGAGLAAHLPGVVASLTAKPVIGVAVNGAFAGLDSFLSIVQMPRGVPVMAVTEENALYISAYLQRLAELPKDKIYLHWDRSLDNYSPLQKAIDEIQGQTGLPVAWAAPADKNCGGEIVTPGDTPQVQGLNIFVCEKTQLENVALALEFFAKARRGGFWVGANNTTNFVNQWKKLMILGAAQ